MTLAVLPDELYGPADVTMTGRYELEATAVHEAAHGVVGVLRDLPVRYATIRARDGGGLLQMNQRRRGSPSRDLIALLAAGAIGEDVAGVCRWDAADSAYDDVRYLRDVAWDWFRAEPDGPTVLDLIANSWAMAHDLIVDNWGAIVAVAVRLVTDRRAVTAAEIRRTITAADRRVCPDPVDHDDDLRDPRTFWVKDHLQFRKWDL